MLAKGADQRLLSVPFGAARELLIDPADQIAFGDVPNEKKETCCCLIKAAVAQARAWHQAIGDLLGVCAAKTTLVVTAPSKCQ